MKFSIVEMTKYWWWVLLCALVGGVIFNAATFFQAPQYIASTEIIPSFDFSNSVYWNDKSMLSFTASLEKSLYDSKIINSVLEEARQKGISLTEQEFHQHTEFEQRLYGWVLSAYFSNPTTAQTIIDLWSETLFNSWMEERQILITAENWQQEYLSLINCFQQMPSFPPHPTCNFENFQELQTPMRQLASSNQEMIEKLQYIQPVPPQFTFTINKMTPSPSQRTKSLDTFLPLIGAIAGMIAGVISLNNHIPQKLLKKVNPNSFG
ncbi:MAG: hypothetical protein K8R40_03055 [Anaerolineaceae bacterium]|nr:hypothetical protein [Anaerolineaceae bacterium]